MGRDGLYGLSLLPSYPLYLSISILCDLLGGNWVRINFLEEVEMNGNCENEKVSSIADREDRTTSTM